MKKRKHWMNHIFNFIAVILGVYLAFFLNEMSMILFNHPAVSAGHQSVMIKKVHAKAKR